MTSPRSIIRVVLLVALSLTVADRAALAAPSQVAPQVQGSVDDTARVILRGNVHPLVLYGTVHTGQTLSGIDQGPVENSMPVGRMLLILQRSPEQEANLRDFIQAAHTPDSPSFHQWLKPEEFGRIFGPADSDVAAVTAWLESHGITVNQVHAGRLAIEFSGTAGQVSETFQTEIHRYQLNGETHLINSTNPSVPAVLAPVIAGLAPLNDFHPQPRLQVLGQAQFNPKTHQATPLWTNPQGGGVAFVVAPNDFATQYDIKPVYSAGITGAGQSIAIVSESNVDLSLVQAYQNLFGLTANLPQVVVDGVDPGQNSAATEAYLDIELAGSVAPGASVLLYTSGGTALTDGLAMAAMRAVEDDQAGVISVSYGECEMELGQSGNAFWSALWQQATAQGQTVFVSAGDGGSAGCDNFDAQQAAYGGLAVNGLASTPYNVAVGGTDFYYSSYNGTPSAVNTQLGAYWSTSSTTTPAVSLKQTIPEQAWNDFFGFNMYDRGNPALQPSEMIIAGGGGASSAALYPNGVATGYAKPAWQTGTGVPADKVRDLPDISLFAANGYNYSFYPVCASPSDCSNFTSSGTVVITGVGGTSASSPAMAAIQALVNQSTGARAGQANFIYYLLAADQPTSFHDVTVGGNEVLCYPGTANCVSGASALNSTGFYAENGYSANTGYDLATGLGSVDVANLIKYWNTVTISPAITTLTGTAVGPSDNPDIDGGATEILPLVNGVTFKNTSVRAITSPYPLVPIIIINILSYAKCDGVTDDRVNIQSAIDAAYAAEPLSGKSIVYFPAGYVCLINSNPNSTVNYNIVETLYPGVGLDGSGTILVGNGVGFYALFGFSSGTVITPTTFQNITIDFNGTNNPINSDPGNTNARVAFMLSPNLPVNGSQGVTFQNLTFVNGAGVWTITANVVDNVTVTHCHWINWGQSGTFNFDSSLIYLEGSGGIVTDNDFTGTGPALRTAIEIHLNNMTVTGNVINNFAVGIIYDANPYTTGGTATNLVISNNTMYVSNIGIVIWTDNGALSGAVISNNNVSMDRQNITTNMGIQGYEQGIAWYQNSQYPLENASITDNMVTWATESNGQTLTLPLASYGFQANYGSSYGYTDNLVNVTIANNTSVNSPLSGFIFSPLNYSGVTVTGNTSINSGASSASRPGGNWASGFVFSGISRGTVNVLRVTNNFASDTRSTARMQEGFTWYGIVGDGAPAQASFTGNSVNYTASSPGGYYFFDVTGPYVQVSAPTAFSSGLVVFADMTSGNYTPFGSTVTDSATGISYVNTSANGLVWSANNIDEATTTLAVTISNNTPQASMYNTTNKTAPTTSYTLYTAPITVSVSEPIEAVATAPGYLQSAVGSATHLINTTVNGCPSESSSCVDVFAGTSATPLPTYNSKLLLAGSANSIYTTDVDSSQVSGSASAVYYYTGSNSDTTQITLAPSSDTIDNEKLACARVSSGIPVIALASYRCPVEITPHVM